MPYWQLFYHCVWATKNRAPLITLDIEQTVYGLLYRKAVALEATVFALNGVEDHVHMVVSIPPKIAVATFIGQVKGVASAQFNKEDRRKLSLYWQDEYGVFSFDGKRLPNYVAYVEKQKEHHAQRATIPVLERTEHGMVKRVGEAQMTYGTEDENWRQELQALAEEQ